MTLQRTIYLAGLAMLWVTGVAGAQSALPPTPRLGRILDVSKDPALAGLAVTRVTVRISDEPADIASELLSAAGVKMVVNPGPYANLDPPLVNIDLHDAPYMEALMEYRQQAQAAIKEDMVSPVALTIRPGQEVPPWCVAGPFGVTLDGISDNVDFSYDQRMEPPKALGSRRRTNLRLGLLAEPGVHLMKYMQDVQFDGLIDDKQQPIGAAIAGFPFNGLPGMVALSLPDSPGRRIPLLKGTIDAKLARTTRVNFDNVTTKQTPPAIEGMTIELSPLKTTHPDKPFYTLQIQYSRGAMPVEQWRAILPVLSSARPRISGQRGNLTVHSRPAVDGKPNDESATVTCGVIFTKSDGPPGKATLDVPLGVTAVRVPFEFKDVILP